MGNYELINGIAAINSVIKAYNEIKEDVFDLNTLRKNATELIETICLENKKMSSQKIIGNSEDGIELGNCKVDMREASEFRTVLEKNISEFYKINEVCVPVKIDYSKPFSLYIEIEDTVDRASLIAQNILLWNLNNNDNLKLRCADLVSGGTFFSMLHGIITRFPNRTGGKIYTKAIEMDDLVKDLEKIASYNMSKISGQYNSVWEYNTNSIEKIDGCINVIYVDENSVNNENLQQLMILMRNREKNGMSFIVIGNETDKERFDDAIDFSIGLKKEQVYIKGNTSIPFEIEERYLYKDNQIDELIRKLESAELIDTVYENHKELHTKCCLMDATDAIRIPLAFDKNGQIRYFEIGGNAPAHALIAGSTGSGKSVALHTIIAQTIHNYHPDDVEIWAIDYKAVEFNRYIDKRTPHFRVIAQETSSEFSLSLIDLLYDEYEIRKKEFVRSNVENINQYRKLYGKNSMSRILVIIDEFQHMTQAVQEYNGNVNYRERLENLLRLTRAMGISFVLCSQTIASGLSGLSDAARDQIGCRVCLKHDDNNEIMETLMLSGLESSEIIAEAKSLKRGQGIYKRVRWANEFSSDGKAFEFIKINILFLSKEITSQLIDEVNYVLQNDYKEKDVIIVKDNGRCFLKDKIRHPIVKFVNGQYEAEDDCVEWYPAAPITLEDSFCIKLENTASANILMIGEDDNMRESILIHSIMGFLMNPTNRVVASFIDENFPDRKRMIGHLRNIISERFELNVGLEDTLRTIEKLKKIKPLYGQNTIYIWYGLEKLKNEIFLKNQDEEEDRIVSKKHDNSKKELVDDLLDFLSELNVDCEKKEVSPMSFEDCKKTLRQAFEVGPENYLLHMAVFNNRKVMKKSEMIDLEWFENRIATKISTDDSYELMGSSMAITKADQNTVVYYDGSNQVIPLRPYLIPESQWYSSFNERLIR